MSTGLRPPSLRTCVGCRGREARSDLLRVVAVEGVLVPDLLRRLGGRGAHLHLVPGCLTLAERRRAWSRAFRAPGPFDATRLAAYLEHGSTTAPAAPPTSPESGSRATRSDEFSMSVSSR